MPYRISIVENAPIECDTPEEALKLAAAFTTGGNMDQMMRDVRRSVISESLIRLGPQYVEEFQQIVLDASQGASWQEWALSVMDKHEVCEKVALKEPFDPDVAREALDTFMRDLVRATALLDMGELSAVEKEYISSKIEKVCSGTPLQPNAKFAGGYLGSVVVSMLENWGIIKEQLRAKDSSG